MNQEGRLCCHERRMAVEAWLAMDPDPVPVVFDTVVESSTGVYQVNAAT